MADKPQSSRFSFFQLQTRAEALARLDRFARLEAQTVPLAESVGRVTAEAVTAPVDLPDFARSTVDGYAVRARETFGASEGSPGLFQVDGEVAMGTQPQRELEPGRTMRVWTGGMLPPGADAVVMLEYARPVDEQTVELTKAVPPGGHTIEVGEDVAQGREVIPAGRPLRAQEIGLLAGLGLTEVQVVRRPRVAIISTGDELVEVGQPLTPGRIREINSHTLSAQVNAWGGRAEYLGLVRDNPDRLTELVTAGQRDYDLVLVSGGSSVGVADWTMKVFSSFDGAEELIHGVAISPGKPLILVGVGQTSLWGLPGHVASAMITAHLFVRPLIQGRLLGLAARPELTVTARLTRNLASSPGREDWVRVRLARDDGGWTAEPVLGPSGLISTLVRADGLIRLDLDSEGLEAGSSVEVYPI